MSDELTDSNKNERGEYEYFEGRELPSVDSPPTVRDAARELLVLLMGRCPDRATERAYIALWNALAREGSIVTSYDVVP